MNASHDRGSKWDSCLREDAITEQLIETRANLDLQHQNGYTPLMIALYRGHAAVATLLLAARDDNDVQTVDLDTVIRGCCTRRLGVWLDEDFHSQAKDEEEEEEEDTSDVDCVEEDEDEEEEEPLID